MSKCVICGKDSGKGKTCSSTCRSRLARSVAKGVASATVEPVGVATLESVIDWQDRAKVLPDCVPDVICKRYALGELDYVAVIDRLLAHTLDELKAEGVWPCWPEGVWVPCWRYEAGQEVSQS